MRPFRNPLIPGVLTACMACACSAQPPAAAVPWIPLAVGNTWTYSCSVEGRAAHRKTQAITAVVDPQAAAPVYRAELRTGRDPKPLVLYLQKRADGRVLQAYAPSMQDAEPLLGAQPRVGERVGAFTVRAVAAARHAQLGQLEQARLDTFDADDPKLTEEQRLTWRGRTYARGIGLLEEADGAGGACVLASHKVRPGS